MNFVRRFRRDLPARVGRRHAADQAAHKGKAGRMAAMVHQQVTVEVARKVGRHAADRKIS